MELETEKEGRVPESKKVFDKETMVVLVSMIAVLAAMVLGLAGLFTSMH